MRIYVGNLSYTTTEESLRETFEKFGEVAEVNIISDRETGRPRGFAFVEMRDEEEAAKAIGALNGTDLDGRKLAVNEARPQRSGGGGGGGGFGGGGGGRFGGGGGGGGFRDDRRGGGGGGGRGW